MSTAEVHKQITADEIAKFTGGKTATQGKISIELPEIAENGNTVPLTFSVDAPMTADNYVSEVLVVAEGNPNPGVATFHFTPLSGKAEAQTRIRLATTQNIVVVAKTSKGEVFTGQKLVKVTRTEDGYERSVLADVRFVPLIPGTAARL